MAHGAACLFATFAFLLLGFRMLYERHCVPVCVCNMACTLVTLYKVMAVCCQLSVTHNNVVALTTAVCAQHLGYSRHVEVHIPGGLWAKLWLVYVIPVGLGPKLCCCLLTLVLLGGVCTCVDIVCWVLVAVGRA